MFTSLFRRYRYALDFFSLLNQLGCEVRWLLRIPLCDGMVRLNHPSGGDPNAFLGSLKRRCHKRNIPDRDISRLLLREIKFSLSIPMVQNQSSGRFHRSQLIYIYVNFTRGELILARLCFFYTFLGVVAIFLGVVAHIIGVACMSWELGVIK